MTSFGQPVILVQDANYANRGELLLRHEHEGIDLKLDWALDTLWRLYEVWSRPVHLETIRQEEPIRFSFDGTEHSEESL